MAINLIEHDDLKLLEVHVTGKLTDEDYKRCIPLFERLTARHGKIRVLFEMSRFHGWEAKALWDDIKFDLKHFKDIERLAMVGDKKWQQWMAAFCAPFTTATVHYFDHDRAHAALAWLRSESARPGDETMGVTQGQARDIGGEPLSKPMRSATKAVQRVGVAADHGGFELMDQLVGRLRAAGHEVVNFGDSRLNSDDDYPDFVVPLARAVASGEVERGVAICGSGVGATVVANKVAGVRACLIHEIFSAHQGVEDDDLNMICLGGLVVGHALAWELVQTFLAARFSGAERHCRRLEKVAELEHPSPRKTP